MGQARATRDDAGVTSAEYGLMLVMVAVVIISAVALVGSGVLGMFTNAVSHFSGF